MTRKGKFVLAGIAAATVGLATAGAMAQRGHFWDGHKGGRHAGHYGGGLMGLGFGGPQRRVCRGDSAEFADHVLVRIEHRVKPTEQQKSAFEDFKIATRSAAEKLREGCPKKPDTTAAAGNEPERRTPIERLAQTEAGLEASLAALREFRPAAEKFYAALSDEQKAKLEPRRGKGKGHWKRDRGPRDRGGEDTPAPENKG
jgi:hypothetical protein